jgi:hypothetical protein
MMAYDLQKICTLPIEGLSILVVPKYRYLAAKTSAIHVTSGEGVAVLSKALGVNFGDRSVTLSSVWLRKQLILKV